MIASKLREPPACPNHLHRDADERCERCFVHYCGECLDDFVGAMLCPRCREEEAELDRLNDEARLTPRNIYRRLTHPGFLIGVAVVFLIIVGLSFFVAFFWRSAAGQLDYEIIRRIRAGFTHSFELGEEGFDFAELLNEGRVRTSSQSDDPEHELDRLIDGLPDPQIPSWRSGNAEFPVEFIFISKAARTLGKISIWNHPEEDPATYIREFEVFTSPVDPAVDDSQLEKVGEFVADRVTVVQRFEFDPPVPTRYTLLRVISNHGSVEYISAAEIGLFPPQPVGQSPIRNPTINPN